MQAHLDNGDRDDRGTQRRRAPAAGAPRRGDLRPNRERGRERGGAQGPREEARESETEA